MLKTKYFDRLTNNLYNIYFSAVQWSEDEHKMFLIGLKKLGKGDWCGISRNYVFSRTPTQVASHAQKYFLRHSNNNARNKRTSVFDIALHEVRIYLSL